MDLPLVLLTVVAPVYIGAMLVLAIALCRAAKRGDEMEIERARPARPAPRPRRERARPRIAAMSGRR